MSPMIPLQGALGVLMFYAGYVVLVTTICGYFARASTVLSFPCPHRARYIFLLYLTLFVPRRRLTAELETAQAALAKATQA